MRVRLPVTVACLALGALAGCVSLKRTPEARFFALRPVAEPPERRRLKHPRPKTARASSACFPSSCPAISSARSSWRGAVRARSGSTSSCVGRSRWTRASCASWRGPGNAAPLPSGRPGALAGLDTAPLPRACGARPLRSPAGRGGVALRPLRSPARAQRAGARHPRRGSSARPRARSERPGTGHRGHERPPRRPGRTDRGRHRRVAAASTGADPCDGHGSPIDVTSCRSQPQWCGRR